MATIYQYTESEKTATWRHKITVMPPASDNFVDASLIYQLEETLTSMKAFDIRCQKDDSSDNMILTFRSNNVDDIELIKLFAQGHREYGFIHQFADLKLSVLIGEITYDSGEVFCEEQYSQPTFDNYLDLGFKPYSYFATLYETRDSVEKAIANPDSSERFLMELKKYLEDEYAFRPDNRILMDIYHHPNFPVEEMPDLTDVDSP